MDVRPLLNDENLDWALKEANHYFGQQPEPGSADGARFQVLLALIENCEDKRWPIDPLATVQPGRAARRFKVHVKQRVPLREMMPHRA